MTQTPRRQCGTLFSALATGEMRLVSLSRQFGSSALNRLSLPKSFQSVSDQNTFN